MGNMEKIRVMGIDPSLRNSGVAIVEYNAELPINDPESFKVCHCQVLTNPQKYTGTNAIMNMLDMLQDCAKEECYQKADDIIIESPAVIFNQAWSAGAIVPVAHIAGGAAVIFGLEKIKLFRPNEWNATKKKIVTHTNMLNFFGDADKWHYETRVKSERFMEHIFDAVSMAWWWIKKNYGEE